MTIYDLIDDSTRKKLNAKEPVVHRQPVKNKETLSKREWENLMGCNRDTYRRSNGRIKRK